MRRLHTNGLIRDFYPKRTDFRLVSDEDIKKVQNILNARPRERLGFIRPSHAMVSHLMAA
jgi:transposase, IS30 family